MDAALRGRIAGGDDNPPFGQQVLAEFPVEHQLITPGLGHLRRGGQLVEKEDALAIIRQELGWSPLCLVCCNARQAAEIDRIELHCPHVEKIVVKVVGDLGDDLRFTNAACSPDVQGHTFADQRMKRLIEFRWFHGISLEV